MTMLHRRGGAGEGNRTLVCSLGSSIEPSPLNDLSAKPSRYGANRVKRLRTERKTLIARIASIRDAWPKLSEIRHSGACSIRMYVAGEFRKQLFTQSESRLEVLRKVFRNTNRVIGAYPQPPDLAFS